MEKRDVVNFLDVVMDQLHGVAADLQLGELALSDIETAPSWAGYESERSRCTTTLMSNESASHRGRRLAVATE